MRDRSVVSHSFAFVRLARGLLTRLPEIVVEYRKLLRSEIKIVARLNAVEDPREARRLLDDGWVSPRVPPGPR